MAAKSRSNTAAKPQATGNEAAATSMLSGRDALDDALPSLFEEASATKPAAEAEPKPKPKPRSRRKAPAAKEAPPAKVEAQTPSAPEQPAPTAQETPEPVESVKDATTKDAAPVEPAETPVEPAPKPAPAAEEAAALSVKAAPTAPRDAPKKRGWWSRGKTGS